MKALWMYLWIVFLGQQSLYAIQGIGGHRVYFGPQIFCFATKADIARGSVSGERVFLGGIVGYERLQEKSWYVGAEGSLSGAMHGFTTAYKKRKFSATKKVFAYGSKEGRIGYNCCTTRMLLTPYLALGWYDFGWQNRYGFKGHMGYFGPGVSIRWAVGVSVQLGIAGKIFRTWDVTETMKQNRIQQITHTNLWGQEVKGGIFWRKGSTEWAAEPYVRQFCFTGKQNIYGIAFTYAWFL